MTESSASPQPIVLVQPIAPVPLFGVAQKLSDGHFATILIAMFAMMITAVSYGRRVRTGHSSGRGKRLEFWTRVVV